MYNYSERIYMKLCKAIFKAMTMFLTLLLLPCVSASAAGRLQPIEGNPVIVIDPGHGGENLGTQTGGIWDEKIMDMITAQALYDELSLYDNVEVYLTRTDDRDVSFQERAAFAQSVNADFLFSIHYNASENHDLFGSEVWVPLSAPFNNYGYQIGCELLNGMEERGLLVRGIKTRQGERGEYYAIIRETIALDIPAAIIEHCHVDEDRDKGCCDSEEDLIRFGKDDATAIAKYFGLKSSILNVDYTDHQLADISAAAPMASTLRDETPPDVCQIEFSDADYKAGYLSLTVSAADYDSPLLYYSYSLDGGQTYSERKKWPGSDVLAGRYEDTFTLSLAIPSGTKPSVIVRAYNMFDPYTDSNRYDSPETFIYNEEPETENPAENDDAAQAAEDEGGTEVQNPGKGTGAFSSGASESLVSSESAVAASGSAVAAEKPVSFVTFLEICLVIVILLFIILLVSQSIAYHNRKKRRRQSRNEAGARRNQHR